MPFDPGHFVERFLSPFNPESRFYWPAVYALLLALVVNIVWYNWRARVTPPENAARPWAFWTNVVFIVLLSVLFIAKAPFYLFLITIAFNAAILVYLYTFVLPPQEAAYEREQRRRAYFPVKTRKRRRR